MKYPVKILCLCMALLTLCSLVCACGNGSKNQKNYVFVSGQVTLEIGALADAPIKALGQPKDFSETGSCGGIPGMDKVYVYSGFTVYTIPGKDGDVISMVELKDDSVATPEGIRIGADKKSVTDAMGAGEDTQSSLIYSGKTGKLTFVFREDKVTNIYYN